MKLEEIEREGDAVADAKRKLLTVLSPKLRVHIAVGEWIQLRIMIKSHREVVEVV